MSQERFTFVSEGQTKQSRRESRRFTITGKLWVAMEFVFGCWHRTLSRPFTLSGWTYEVCLGCGRKFAYNRAPIGRPLPIRQQLDPQPWENERGTLASLSHLR